MAQNEPPHLDLHCLPCSVSIFNMTLLGRDIFQNFADVDIVVCFFFFFGGGGRFMGWGCAVLVPGKE